MARSVWHRPRQKSAAQNRRRASGRSGSGRFDRRRVPPRARQRLGSVRGSAAWRRRVAEPSPRRLAPRGAQSGRLPFCVRSGSRSAHPSPRPRAGEASESVQRSDGKQTRAMRARRIGCRTRRRIRVTAAPISHSRHSLGRHAIRDQAPRAATDGQFRPAAWAGSSRTWNRPWK